mgnify:FL=1
MLSKMNKIELYVAGKDADINDSAKNAFEYVLAQNDPVGTIAGYYDEKLTIWTVSNYFLQILGYGFEEFMEAANGSMRNVICSDQINLASLEEIRNFQGERTMYLMDSKGFPILVRIVKTDSRNNEGEPVWVLSVRSDRAAQNLELVNELVENGLWSIDYDLEEKISKITKSETFCRMLGYQDKSEAPDTIEAMLDSVHPEDRPKLMDFMRKIPYDTHNEKYEAEYRIRMQDGSYQWFGTNCKAVRRMDGSLSQLVGVIVNVDKRRKASEQEAREDAFHRAFTDLNICEYYVDLQENTFESMKVENPLQEIFNKSRTWDELIQMFLDNYVCPESKETVAQIYNREYIMKELREITGELSQECKVIFDGKQRIVSNVVMAGDTDENGDPKHAMIFLRDVTDSKNAEKERRKMLRQNIAMDQLLQGVTRIVERFAVCDLDSGLYDYYEMNNDAVYQPAGDYLKFIHYMSQKYVVITESINAQMEYLLSPEHLRKVILSEEDQYTFEYCNFDKSSYKVMSVIPVEWKGSVLSKVMLIVQDIGQKHELEKLANTDGLTGLYNERYLSTKLKQNGKFHKKFAMFYLDLDRFKPVNDTYGHDMGDKLLKAVSQRLRKCIRNTDYAFRIGGDEFSLIIEEGNINDEFCEMMVRRIKNAIDAPFVIEGNMLHVDTSCGYAIYPEHSPEIGDIRIMADHRMYRDKIQNRKKG